MRAAVFALCLAFSAPVWCTEDIVAVLQRSQQQRLDTLTEVEPGTREEAAIRASFDRLTRSLKLSEPVTLRVVRGPIVAECLMGRIIVANVSLAELGEGQRLFVLAHELGHVMQGHWSQMGRLFQKHIPDEVVQEKTDAVAGALGRDASRLSHEQEFEADAFALHTIANFGEPRETAIEVFRVLPMTQDTATHPGTRKRVAHLRVID
jgi:Zn-dependent protease with chaperone function